MLGNFWLLMLFIDAPVEAAMLGAPDNTTEPGLSAGWCSPAPSATCAFMALWLRVAYFSPGRRHALSI